MIAKPDIFKAETSGKMWKIPEVVFSNGRTGAFPPAATPEVANRKKPEIQREKQKPGSIDLQCPGESKWGTIRVVPQWGIR